MLTFKSNGKLLLTGEYVVLDGAKTLAIPTKYGQSLVIEETKTDKINWKSYNENNTLWFEGEFMITENSLKPLQNNDISNRIVQIFDAVGKLNPEFLITNKGYEIKTYLDFPTNWGLGTSSTLINNIAQWSNVNPFKLLKQTFGGSGYDIACAQNNTPIVYQINTDGPKITPIKFHPEFINNLYFVHLNKKQNSRDGIAHYRAQKKDDLEIVISEINSITENLISSNNLETFNKLVNKHELLISETTQQETVKSKYFKDFDGSVKSLGAWGGDFILAASKTNPTSYFESKGFNTIIPYKNMVLM